MAPVHTYSIEPITFPTLSRYATCNATDAGYLKWIWQTKEYYMLSFVLIENYRDSDYCPICLLVSNRHIRILHWVILRFLGVMHCSPKYLYSGMLEYKFSCHFTIYKIIRTSPEKFWTVLCTRIFLVHSHTYLGTENKILNYNISLCYFMLCFL